ncbi:alpha/beta hydrolase [Rubritalea sp.]|uniref:alpha/beta hydrolase n=1 Tax=Rubritalea sp. TaxID=2109375 RepID=UPI003EF73E3A
MHKIAKHSFNIARRAIGYGLIGSVIALLSVGIYTLEKRPDLSVWHTVDLDEEFTRDSDVTDFAGYLKLEDRLFQQLEQEVYQKTGKANDDSINRFQHGSATDPTAMAPNWNRSFTLDTENPTAGVLLLHGLTDSPYSLRSYAESFHASGASVIGLRIPGHGTTPSGLVKVSWLDMAAAVRLAAEHLRATVGDKPIYVVGYSNGGALAVHYCLETLHDPTLPKVDKLILFSPEIGITPTAAMAVWQGRLGHWLGLEKLAWTSINLEYDPYKYNSFAVNAGHQAYLITKEIEGRLAKMSEQKQLADFPPTLAFQSAVDATVSAPDLVTRLFDKLPQRGHELVIFDRNHGKRIKNVLAPNAVKALTERLKGASQSFTLTILSNRDTENTTGSGEVLIHRRPANQNEIETLDSEISWPSDIFSLSHIALPFPPSDPIYGNGGSANNMTLGNLALRGEKGAILISPNEMLRQHWNPFFPWVQNCAHAHFELPTP